MAIACARHILVKNRRRGREPEKKGLPEVKILVRWPKNTHYATPANGVGIWESFVPVMVRDFDDVVFKSSIRSTWASKNSLRIPSGTDYLPQVNIYVFEKILEI